MNLEQRYKALEAENAKLRWHLAEVRRILERMPNNGLPKTVRVKNWFQQTAFELTTRTMPRMFVIWGGAAFVAYLVRFHF